MPALARVLTQDDLSPRSQSSSGLDLTPYREMIRVILDNGGLGGVIDLGPEEGQRSEKGRMTRAAREAGRQLVWRKSDANQLKFVLAEPNGPVPGARARRRPPADVTAEQTVIDAVMTPDVAEVTDTEAATEETPAPVAPRRGRPRKTR